MTSKTLKYEERSNYLYFISKRTNRDIVKWINCKCGKHFKSKDKDEICPNCKQPINNGEVVAVDTRRISFYNKLTTMFIDDDIVTISMFIVGAHRNRNSTNILHPKGSFNLKIRFNTTNRTALLYTNNYRFLPGRRTYINFTQPVVKHFEGVDIVLPRKMQEDFCNVLGVNLPERNLNIYDLAWINRTKSSQRDMLRLYEITRLIEVHKQINAEEISKMEYNLLNDVNWRLQFENEDINRIVKSNKHGQLAPKSIELISLALEATNNYPFLKNKIAEYNLKKSELIKQGRNLRRLKVYLKENHKVKNFDRDIIESLLSRHNIDENILSDNLKKALYENPWSLKHFNIFKEIFYNENVLIKAIEHDKILELVHVPEFLVRSFTGFKDRGEILLTFSRKARIGGTSSLSTKNIADIENKIFNLLFNTPGCICESIEELISLIHKANRLIEINKLNFIIKNDLHQANKELAYVLTKQDDPKINFTSNFPSEDIEYRKKFYGIKRINSSGELLEINNKINKEPISIINYEREGINSAILLSSENEDKLILTIEMQSGRNTAVDIIGESENRYNLTYLKILLDYTKRNNIDPGWTELNALNSSGLKVGKINIIRSKK